MNNENFPYPPSLMDPVTAIEEEGKPEMVGGNRYLRRCTSKNILNTTIYSLSDDLLFDILTRLTAEDIFKSTRLVCRTWYKMIHTDSFVRAHHHNSTEGLLVQNLNDVTDIAFLAMRQGQIEISKFNYKFRHLVRSSCNGLMLDSNLIDMNKYEFNLFITNPATNQQFALAPFPYRKEPHGYSSLAYAADSMEYKVVCTYEFENGGWILPSQARCAILTAGIDNSWRKVDTKHLSSTGTDVFRSRPLVTEGFVHWAQYGTYVLTLNVETEIVTQFPVPQCNGRTFGYFYFQGLGHLSLLVARSYFSLEVWEMKPENGEWTRLTNINLRAQVGTFKQLCCEHDSSFKPDGGRACKLIPAGWLKYKEVLVFVFRKEVWVGIFNHTRMRVAYNVQTHEIIYLFELESGFCPYVVHRNSLLWLDG